MSNIISNFTAQVVKLHSGQFRKTKINGVAIPYSWHVIEVPKLIYRWGIGTEVNLLGGLGHDLEEDCKLTEAEIIEILQHCGANAKMATAAAKIITDLSFLPPEGITDKEQRKLKQDYLQSFIEKPINTVIIKGADRLCNSWDFAMTDPAYAVKYFDKAGVIFDTIFSRKREFDHSVYRNILKDVEEFNRQVGK